MSSSALPPFRYLFRYRDLVAKTLEEHQKILNNSAGQGCWWGWWKRPHEDARREVWEALKEQITSAPLKRVRVGLFDSGASDNVAVRGVWIDKVEPPTHDGASLDPLPLGADDLLLVPPYYRNSPFSRAWMRIVEIDQEPVDFFGKYSHEQPPPLPNYSPGALKRLAAKVIIDAAELRGMDSTIWLVRPKAANDRDERLFMPSPYIEAVTRDPVAIKGDTILHLTDMHFSMGATRAQHAWRLESETTGTISLAEAVANATKKSNVGVLLITGDFSFLAEPTEFNEAKASIARLMGILGLGLEQVVIVPGNHDLKWTKSPSDKYDANEGVSQAPREAQAAYRAFFSDLFRVNAHDALAMARRYVFPHGGLVEIGGVNSSSLEQGKHFLAGMGRVRGGGFESIVETLGWNDSSPSHAIRILGLHHHLISTEEVEDPAEYEKGFGIAIDARNTQRLCARAGVHLVVHGHRHRAFVGRTQVCELPEENNDRWTLGNLSIVGGGSAGSTDVVANSNFFTLIKISSDELCVGFHRSKDKDRFAEKAASLWRAPLALENGKLALGEWTTTAAKD